MNTTLNSWCPSDLENEHSTLLYSTLLYSTLLYSTLLYSTLLYSIPLFPTLPYYSLHSAPFFKLSFISGYNRFHFGISG